MNGSLWVYCPKLVFGLEVLFEDAGRVDRIVILSSILAGEL